MKRKKNIWVQYGRSVDLIEITIRDSSGAKIESFKFNGANSKIYAQAIQQIKDKYGWSPEIEPERISWFNDQ